MKNLNDTQTVDLFELEEDAHILANVPDLDIPSAFEEANI